MAVAEVCVLLALTLVLMVLAVLYGDRDMEDSCPRDENFQVLEDAERRALSLKLSRSAVDRFFSDGRLPQLGSLYSFATGLLAGLGAFLLWLQIENPARAASVWSPFVWLLAVGFVWVGVFILERRIINRLAARGVFDRAIAAGADPLEFAAETCLRGQVFEYWSFPIALAGVAAASPVGGIIPAVIILAFQAIRAVLDSRKSAPKVIVARDLGKAISPVAAHIADGGWVTTLGILLGMASLGLAHLEHRETIVVAGCIFILVGLVIWSERVSRAKSGLKTADQLRLSVRAQLAARELAGARVETMFQQDN